MRSRTTDSLFLQEQRRFKRLEVSLPVWITVADAAGSDQEVPWELGYTRDISLGGSKIVVPPGEEEQWREAMDEGVRFVVRFDDGSTYGELIPGYVRFAAPDKETGRFALGLQFDETVARPAREAAVRSGLKSMQSRRKWQWAFVAAFFVVLAVFLVNRQLTAEVASKNAQITQLQKQKAGAEADLERLSRPTLASTRAEGIVASFQRKEVQKTLRELDADIKRLNDPKNMAKALAERQAEARRLGLNIRPASTAGKVQWAVAFPYGYNWPQVLGNLETLLERKIPHVVIFTDWTMPFPDLDAREARARGKVLQVTWEPWHFGNKNAVQLKDIAAGKHDAYVDRWANGARAFGGELWVRWGHEFNGNWYPWSTAGNGSNTQNWQAAYKRIHGRFKRAGASNVRWIWCINAETVPNVAWNDPLRNYPGSAYVDVVAIDGYNFGRSLPFGKWMSFQQLFAGPYQKVTTKFPDKPIWIAETGSSTVGGDKTQWLKEMDVSLRRDFPKVESVTWFEAEKEADWRLISSPSTLAAARSILRQPYYSRGSN